VALITAAQARAYLPDLTGTGEDSALDVVIARAGEILARLCGFPPATVGAAPTMESASYTRYYDPARAIYANALRLGIYPVTAVASVYDDTDETYGSNAEVTTDDYRLVGDIGTIRLKPTGTHAWSTTGARTIKVAFTAGYASTPPVLAHACALLTRDLWAGRHTAQPAGSSPTGNAQVSREVAAALAPYMLPAALGVGYQGEP